MSSFRSTVTSPETVTLSRFGVCTLLPLDSLPEKIRTYKHLLATAQGLGLREFQGLDQQGIQEIIKVSVCKLIPLYPETYQGVSIWISEKHLAYHCIMHAAQENDCKQTECITSVEMVTLGGEDPIDIFTTEVPVNDLHILEHEDMVYGIFVGEI